MSDGQRDTEVTRLLEAMKGKSGMMTIELKLTLPDDLLATLQQEAQNRALPLDALVVDLLRDSFGEPTKEDILQGIREGMRDALRGNTRPAREFLDELEAETLNEAEPG